MTKIKDILSIRLEDDIKSVIDLNQQVSVVLLMNLTDSS